LRAAIQRVRWELDVLRSPQRNPLFYIDQTLGSVFELLILSSPITPERAENIVLRLEAFPDLTQAAYTNLDQAVRPFSRAAIAALIDIDERLRKMRIALQLHFPEALRERLHRATKEAVSALQAYARWLESADPIMTDEFSLGTDAYSFFLANVALIPHTPEELLAQGRLAWERAVTFDTLEKNRNASLPPLTIFADIQAQTGYPELALPRLDRSLGLWPGYCQGHLHRLQLLVKTRQLARIDTAYRDLKEHCQDETTLTAAAELVEPDDAN